MANDKKSVGATETCQQRHLLSQMTNIYEHGGTRTPDPQDRNLMLYPLSYIPSSL